MSEILVYDRPSIDLAAIQYCVYQLTRPRIVHVEGHALARPALITQLIAGIKSDAGGTKLGASLPSERSAMDLGAFRLYEDISGRIASMLDSAAEMPPTKDPRTNLDRWFDAFELAWHRGQITYEAQLRNQYAVLMMFAKRIASHFDPVSQGELRGACPNCGETRWFSDSRGSQTTALFTLRRDGYVEAGCHWCDKRWTGVTGLSSLRLAMSDTPDFSDQLRSAT